MRNIFSRSQGNVGGHCLKLGMSGTLLKSAKLNIFNAYNVLY